MAAKPPASNMSDSASQHHLTDFSDRFSPMLVKELRQGMRTNLFTIAFILLQAFMVLCVLIGASAPGDSSAVSGFFWFFVVVTLLIVMPIRGFSALTSEMQLNTMDLIQLTRMGAWRMTFGKWAALVAQSLLLVCGILPYLVMRYFFGGIDLFNEILALFSLFVASMLFTAVTVGFSAFRSVLLRSVIVVVLLILSLNVFGIRMIANLGLASSGASTSNVVWGYLSALLTAVYLMWFMLDLGASRIAPEADNHATRKRLAAFAFGFVFLLIPLTGLEAIPFLLITGITWTLVCIDALTERPSVLPSLLRPFSNPWYRRPFVMLLTPGWPSGLFFYLLCALVYAAALMLHEMLGGISIDLQEVQAIVSCAALVLFPLIPIHLFFRKVTEPASIFGIYLLIQICAGVVGFFLMIMAEETGVSDVAYLFAPLPATTLFASMAGAEETAHVIAAAALALIAIIITIVRGMPWYRDTVRVMDVLRESSRS